MPVAPAPESVRTSDAPPPTAAVPGATAPRKAPLLPLLAACGCGSGCGCGCQSGSACQCGGSC